jgi:predicted MFS family arabinose efflux permease
VNRPVSPPAEDPLTHAQIRTILWGVVLAMLLGALDQTIVATALPTIGRELNDVQHLSWVVTAYLLTATAVTPLYGKLSDIHGRRLMLLVSIGVFLVGSIACALARDIFVLIGARALQGLGGGGLLSLGMTIIGDVIAPRERGRYHIKPTSPRSSSPRRSPAPCSAACLPNICTGPSSSGSTCRSAPSPMA